MPGPESDIIAPASRDKKQVTLIATLIFQPTFAPAQTPLAVRKVAQEQHVHVVLASSWVYTAASYLEAHGLSGRSAEELHASFDTGRMTRGHVVATLILLMARLPRRFSVPASRRERPIHLSRGAQCVTYLRALLREFAPERQGYDTNLTRAAQILDRFD